MSSSEHATDALLTADDPPPFETFAEHGGGPFVLTCDHAGHVLPRRVASLGVSAAELTRHIAWDIGAAGLARALSARLDAFLILQTYSRLLIDVNRPPGAPDSIVALSERTHIPGNVDLSAEAAAQRCREVFEPYHDRIASEVDRRVAAGMPTILVALHSFTPRFKDVDREWHAGVLYGRDDRVARIVLQHLRADGQLVVGDNQPYAVSDDTDYTVVTHAERRGLPYVELEIRQDLLADAAGQRAWAERIATGLELSFSALFPA
jgi:predicted N-formylglutamate amidohydrolase